MSTRRQRWLIGIALAVVLCALRFPWIECDPGNWGIWGYGTFSTDEGEYTGGGRLMFLTGKWLDSEMGYPSTLTYAPAMHLLSAISYEICGLRIAAARWPSMLAAVIAWLLIYHMASRTTAPWLAGAVTLVASCNPASLTYERWGSSDVLFATGIVAGWWLLRKPSLARATLAGVAAAFAVLAKMTAIVFVPFLFAAILTRPKRRLWRAVCFVAGFVVLYATGQLWVKWQLNQAILEGLNPMDYPHVEGILTFNVMEMLKALAVFPRAYTAADLGPFIFWAMILPLWYLAILWQRTGRLLTPRIMMCAGLFVYVGILALQPRNPCRYFVPLLFFAPLLLVYARRLLPRADARPRVFAGATLVALVVLFAVYWRPVHLPKDGLKNFFSNAYILPDGYAWVVTWPVLLISIALLIAVAVTRLGWRGGFRHWFMIGALGIGAGWLFACNYGYAAMGRQSWFIPNQILIQCTVLTAFILILAGRRWIRWRHWYLCAALVFYAAVIFNPAWLRARPDLLTRRHSARYAATRIERQIPSNAIVIGRRATTLLQSTRLRVGHYTLCSLGKDSAPVFVKRVSELLRTAPQGVVYWLVASDEIPNYVSPHEKQVSSRFRIELLDKVPVLADSAPLLVPLYVVRLQVRFTTADSDLGGIIHAPLGR